MTDDLDPGRPRQRATPTPPPTSSPEGPAGSSTGARLDSAAVERAGRAALDAYEAIPYENDLDRQDVWQVLGTAALAAARDGEALSNLDLTVTRGLIASRGWIGGDLASALVAEVERLTAVLAARGTAAPTVTAEQRAAVRAAIVDTIRDGDAWDGDAMADAALDTLRIEVREP